MSTEELPWFKCNPTEWLQSCADMDSETFGYYARLILFMYQRGGLAPFDEGKLRHIWNCSRQRARKVRDELISEGRIETAGDALTQSRVVRELRIARKIDQKLSENPAKTEQKVEKNPAKTPEVFSDKSLETNDPPIQIPDTRYQNPQKPPSGGVEGEGVKAIAERCQTVYPGKGWRRTEPWASQRAILRLLTQGEDGDRIVAACKAYAAENGDAPHKFDNFLNTGLWRNFAPAGPSGVNWSGHVSLFVTHGKWMADGPKPGEPGCRAPAEVLAEYGYAPGKPEFRVVGGEGAAA